MTNEAVFLDDEEIYVTLIETSKWIFLLTGRDGMISVDRDIDTARGWFEKTYRSAGSSGVFHWLTYHPSVVRATPQLVKEWIGLPFKLTQFSNISGTVFGVLLKDQEEAKRLWDKGSKPSIV